MDWDDAAKLVAALGPVIVAWLGLQASRSELRGRRARLMQDVELLKLLPQDSESKRVLEIHIERAISRLAEDDEKTRDPFGIVLALLFLASAGWGWVQTLAGSNWWLVLALPSTVIGIVGFTRDIVPAKRDSRGRPLT